MTIKKYKDEIQLIKNQNNTEVELYPLIAEIIEPTMKDDLSKRYVFARRKTELGQIYYGISSFPDLAILDRDFISKENKEIKIENWEKLRGCIEAKSLGNRLYSLSDIKSALNNLSISDGMGQLIGEILWYKKVLYTNGIVWKLFSIDSYDGDEKNVIIEIVNERVCFGANADNKGKRFVWWEDKSIFKTIKAITNKIKEEDITDNCLDDWEDFIKKIKNIEWK